MLLNSTEQHIVYCLAQNGQLLASSIANKTGIKRPTVYATLNKLIDESMVLKLVRNNGTYFRLVDPDVIEELIRLKMVAEHTSDLEKLKDLTNGLKSKMENQHKMISGFEISAIQSASVVYHALSQAFKESGVIKAIFNPQLVVSSQQGKEVVLDFLKTTLNNKVKIQEIAVEGPECDWYKKQIFNPLHELKTISASLQITTDFILADGQVYFLHYNNEEGAGIHIKHAKLHQSLEIIFDLLWTGLAGT